VIFRPDAGGAPEQRFFHLQENNTDTRMLFETRVIGNSWCLDGFSLSGKESKALLDREKLHPLGAWYHAALVYDGRELRTFVDRVLEGSGEVHLAPQGAGRTSIGVRINRVNYFKGAVLLARMSRRALAPAEFLNKPGFREHAIAADLKSGYQVVAADLNHDGKPDLIALSSTMNELVWYENPTWERHVIGSNFARMINCVVVGNEIVLASGFAMQTSNSAGIVSVLRPNGDPRKLWSAVEIDRLTTSHRLRLADIEGNGKPVVINSALTGAKAEAPDYRDQTPLVFYRPGVWKREEIRPQNSGLVHGLSILDWDADGRDEILTSGFEGIHLFKLGTDGKWSRTPIASGAPDPWPKSGSSDVAVGHVGRERFLAAIEPWHGSQVAIYRLRGGRWEREVIDTSLVDGHTIQVADFDGDGNDEVIAGYRGKGRSIYLYRLESSGGRWSKEILDDGGMAAAACAIADLNQDGRPDIACIGSDTGNLKWYENLGPAHR
jgi:hypothetical protein